MSTYNICYLQEIRKIYRINPPIRRGFFQKKKPQKIQTRLIIEVFGHIGILGKVRWCHVVTENANLRNR